MGTQEGERDWVDVANDLLSKCHINLRLRKLTECDASVFIALYENILGEKVPDYIAAPRSQEDDIHNIQSVIDSLSLDYLQLSLSHITGENVVRGDKESIRNLLEIFDGLLEYLKEEISEELETGEETFLRSDSDSGNIPGQIQEAEICNGAERNAAELDRASSCSSGGKHSIHSWNAEDLGSDSELIGLGVSARTFSAKQTDPITTSGPLDDHDGPLSESLPTAIALQPPHQSNRPPVIDGHSLRPAGEETAPAATETSGPPVETVVTNGLQSPAVSQRSLSSQLRARTDVEGETLELANGGPRRVLFRTEPDVLFLTLRDEMAAATPSPPDTEDENVCYSQDRRMQHRDRRSPSSRSRPGEVSCQETYRSRRNKLAEKELHHISEKLSHRLTELDQMLKRVMGESGEPSEDRGGDYGSHHSDDIVESHRSPTQHADLEACDVEDTHQTESPPRVRPSLQGCLEDHTADNSSLDDGVHTVIAPSDQLRREDPHHRKRKKHLQSQSFGEQKQDKDRERADVDKARRKAQEAERHYREAILGDVSQATRTKAQRRAQDNKLTTSVRRHREAPRRAPSLKVKENELLPLVLEELPHLHISPHTLGRMWEQQIQQVDRLHAVGSPHGRRRSDLSSQLEEAQRKHDLLVEILRKEQESKRRLRDVRERVQQQKSTQNRLKEQRQQMARAKKYYNEYHVQHRARLMRARTKEEKMVRQLFEEGLELQKARLREQRAYAKEQRLEHQRRHQDQITSMENYYKDQFALLAEKLAQERQEIQVRKKAQEKTLLKMKRELRSTMEREIEELQKIIVQNDEDDHIQGLEVQRLRNRIQMASFHYNTSYLH